MQYGHHLLEHELYRVVLEIFEPDVDAVRVRGASERLGRLRERVHTEPVDHSSDLRLNIARQVRQFLRSGLMKRNLVGCAAQSSRLVSFLKTLSARER